MRSSNSKIDKKTGECPGNARILGGKSLTVAASNSWTRIYGLLRAATKSFIRSWKGNTYLATQSSFCSNVRRIFQRAEEVNNVQETYENVVVPNTAVTAASA